jgi:hypothetical protein
MAVRPLLVRLALALVVLALVYVPLQALAQIPPAAASYRADLVRSARLVWGLDAPIATLAAQVHQESAWRPDARSPYAHGLAQFTPDTAIWIAGMDAALAGADTGNPVWALRALARYDQWLYQRVGTRPAPPGLPSRGGDNGSPPAGGSGLLDGLALGRPGGETATANDCARWANTLRAYNGGLGYVQKEAKSGKPCAAFRAAWACKENLAYPQHILVAIEPRYVAAGWGRGLRCAA